jgi:hypothetical protein
MPRVSCALYGAAADRMPSSRFTRMLLRNFRLSESRHFSARSISPTSGVCQVHIVWCTVYAVIRGAHCRIVRIVCATQNCTWSFDGSTVTLPPIVHSTRGSGVWRTPLHARTPRHRTTISKSGALLQSTAARNTCSRTVHTSFPSDRELLMSCAPYFTTRSGRRSFDVRRSLHNSATACQPPHTCIWGLPRPQADLRRTTLLSP